MKTKKAVSLILALITTFSLTACGEGSDVPATKNTPKTDDTTAVSTMEIVYTDTSAETTAVSTPVDPNERGNTASNIQNRGSMALKGDWIYFKNMNGTLKKTRTDGTEELTLLEMGCHGGINVVGDWVYYTDMGKISKIRTDGTEMTDVLDSFELYSPASCVTVIGEWIYFLKPTSNNSILCKVKTDGSEETILLENSITDVSVVEDWINYFDISKRSYCKMKTDGTEQSIIEIVSDLTRVDTSEVSHPIISDDYIYWLCLAFNNKIIKMGLDGSDVTELKSNGTYGDLAVDGEWIYFTDNDPEHQAMTALFKMDTDGNQVTQLTPYEYYNYYEPNIVGDWIYYLGETDEGRGMSRVRTGGTEEQIVALLQ